MAAHFKFDNNLHRKSLVRCPAWCLQGDFFQKLTNLYSRHPVTVAVKWFQEPVKNPGSRIIVRPPALFVLNQSPVTRPDVTHHAFTPSSPDRPLNPVSFTRSSHFSVVIRLRQKSWTNGLFSNVSGRFISNNCWSPSVTERDLPSDCFGLQISEWAIYSSMRYCVGGYILWILCYRSSGWTIVWPSYPIFKLMIAPPTSCGIRPVRFLYLWTRPQACLGQSVYTCSTIIIVIGSSKWIRRCLHASSSSSMYTNAILTEKCHRELQRSKT
jgi:hypothetical protein